MNPKALALTFCIIFLQVSASFAASTCKEIFLPPSTEISLKTPNAKISTRESLPTVALASKKLNDLIDIASANHGTLSAIYREAMPVLIEASQLARLIIRSRASDQNQVYEFFYKFSLLIDLPTNYTNAIGRRADGFDNVPSFSEAAFQERLGEFLKTHRSPDPILKTLIAEITSPPSATLSSSFNLIRVGGVLVPDDLSFSFQYQYIVKEGLLPLLDLFAHRESGRVYLGASFRPDSEYDSRIGTSAAFIEHDLIHAFTQKYFDQLLFNEFGANTLQKQVRLKRATNKLLQARIREYQSLSDPVMRDAVEVVYFSLLHEQSLTYPIGTSNELTNSNRFEAYGRSIPRENQNNRFGEQYKYLQPGLISEALAWVKVRAEADSRSLREEFKIGSNP